MLKTLKECLHQQKKVVICSLGISGNTKLIVFWTCSLRILMHHPTFIGNGTQSFFPMISNTSKPAWTNAASSLPLWFHVMECLKMKSRCNSTRIPCRKPRKECRKVLLRNIKLHEAFQLYFVPQQFNSLQQFNTLSCKE